MKKLLPTLGILAFALTACGGRADFYGKTLVYKGTHDDLDTKLQDGSTNRIDFTKNFASIDWSNQQTYQLQNHTTVDSSIAEMQQIANSAFSGSYTGFSIAINPESSGQATVTLAGGQSTGYSAKYTSESRTIMELKTGDYVEYTLYHILSNNGKFQKVTLNDHGSDIKKTFTFMYTHQIESVDGVQITYYANFLPQ